MNSGRLSSAWSCGPKEIIFIKKKVVSWKNKEISNDCQSTTENSEQESIVKSCQDEFECGDRFPLPVNVWC